MLVTAAVLEVCLVFESYFIKAPSGESAPTYTAGTRDINVLSLKCTYRRR